MSEPRLHRDAGPPLAPIKRQLPVILPSKLCFLIKSIARERLRRVSLSRPRVPASPLPLSPLSGALRKVRSYIRKSLPLSLYNRGPGPKQGATQIYSAIERPWPREEGSNRGFFFAFAFAFAFFRPPGPSPLFLPFRAARDAESFLAPIEPRVSLETNFKLPLDLMISGYRGTESVRPRATERGTALGPKLPARRCRRGRGRRRRLGERTASRNLVDRCYQFISTRKSVARDSPNIKRALSVGYNSWSV